MKRFAFIVQPYGQRIQVYYNYPRAALERVMARHGIANDPPWSDVFTAGSVEGRVIVMALFHSTPAVWVERLAHEAYHATQIMHAIYGFSLTDPEAGPFITGYIARKLYERCR